MPGRDPEAIPHRPTSPLDSTPLVELRSRAYQTRGRLPAQKRPPTLEHIRDLWTLHWAESNCTAAIWRNDFGLELRVLHEDELVESRLSRVGEAPLLLIADEVKTNLIAQGWTEAPNET